MTGSVPVFTFFSNWVGFVEMNVSVFLNDLANRKIKLWVEDGKLRFKAPKGAMTAEIKQMLKQRKLDLIEILSPQATPVGPQLPPMEPAAATRRAPLTFAQARMVFLHQLFPDSPQYNMPIAYDFEGPLSVVAMETALAMVIARQEALRTRFVEELDGFTAHIEDPPQTTMDVVDMANRHAVVSVPAFDQLLTRDARLLFDLAKSPLIRMRIYRLDANRHCLLFCMHHIISDGWSLGVFFRELHHCYRQVLVGGRDLEPLVFHYRDVAFWQQHEFQGPVLEQMLDHWENILAGVNPELALPFDRDPVDGERYGGLHTFYINPEASAAFRSLCQQREASPFMSLAALYGLLLYHLTGQTDLAIGTPVAGRDHGPVENLVGLFVNTLVLRLRMDPDASFAAAIDATRKVCLEAFAHAATPLEKIIERLKVNRQSDGNPFQTIFSLQNASDHQLSFPAAAVAPHQIKRQVALFPIQLEFQDLGDQFFGYFEYDRHLFDHDTIALFADGLQALVQQFVHKPDLPLHAYSLLDEAERQRLLNDWGDGGQQFNRQVDVATIFRETCAANPDAVAIVDPTANRHFTYKHTEELALDMAYGLVARGVQPEQTVAMLTDRTPSAVIAKLGILIAGGCYVPLDPNAPEDRLAIILEDSAPELILVEPHLKEKLPPSKQPTIPLVFAQPNSAKDLPRLDDPERLAYIMYTSGSTGRPKGVAIVHRSIVNLACDVSYLQLGVGKRYGQTGSLAFDLSTIEIYGSLLNGGTMVMIEPNSLLAPYDLKAILDQQQLHNLDLTTAILHQMAALEPDIFRNLQWLGCGGEALDSRAPINIIQAGPPQHLRNTYGPTECTVFSTFQPITHVPTGAVPIGKPIRHTRAYVVDPRLQLIPPKVPGELCIGGSRLARGYFGQPARTASVFVPDPFAETPGARMYRTGDRVRWNRDGEIEFKGRVDFQIKLRGIRMEPGEIENRLIDLPGIANALVMLRKDANDMAYLAAFLVVTHQAAAVDPQWVSQQLSHHLPAAMIPTRYAFLPGFPLNVNGKVDRKALATMPLQTGGAQASDATPETDTQRRLADIWTELLGVDTVGIHDAFFDLGGHSLLATRLMAHIAAQFGVRPSLRQFFDRPTIADLAQLIDQAGAGTGTAIRRRRAQLSTAAKLTQAVAVICTDVVDMPLPTNDQSLNRMGTVAMRRVLDTVNHRFEVQIAMADFEASASVGGLVDLLIEKKFASSIVVSDEVTPAAFTETCLSPQQYEVWRNFVDRPSGLPADLLLTRTCDEPFDISAFTTALEHHGPHTPLLSARFALDNHVPKCSAGTWQNQWQVMDFADATTLDQRLETIQHAALNPLDGPGWQLILLRSPTRERLALRIHRLLADATAANAWFANLWQIYLITTKGKIPTTSTYQDYAHDTKWRLQNLFANENQNQLTYWRDTFSALPPDIWHKPVTDNTSPRVKHRQGRIPKPSLQAIDELAQASERTREDFFMAATLILLAYTSGETDLCLGSYHRFETPTENPSTLGPIENRLPLRLQYKGTDTWSELATQVHQRLQEAREHSALSWPVINGLIAAASETNLHPALWLRQWPPQEDYQLMPRPEDLAHTMERPHLIFMDDPTHVAVDIVWLYDADRWSDNVIDRLAQRFERLLDVLVADPGIPADNLDLVLPQEREQLLRVWNDTDVALPPTPDPAVLTRAVAIEAPDRTAVVDCGQTPPQFLSYGCLHGQAQQIAQGLLASGARVNQPVGIQVGRSPQMLVAMLGVLEAGCGYLPLDPDLPFERAQYMLTDAGVRLLITPDGMSSLSHLAQVAVVAFDALIHHKSVRSTPQPHVPTNALAYIMYTSGSTGRPKGTVISRRNIARLITGHSYLSFNRDRIIAQAASAAFDAATFEIWGALAHGARTALIPFTITVDGQAMRATLHQQAVDTLFLTTALFNNLVHETGVFEKLDYLYFGGEAADLKAIRTVLSHAPRHLANIYGPTECTTFSSWWPIDEAILDKQIAPIGQPIANTTLFVVNRGLYLMPPNVRGELLIGGEGLASHYHQRPAMTAEKFVPNPFSDRPGERLYRTGDLVYRLEDGAVVFAGRIDNQVKIRGYRIELGEIKNALENHPLVETAYVGVRANQAEDKVLMAWIQVPGSAVSPQSGNILKKHLGEHMPAYMVPKFIIPMAALPLNANGKVDHRALPGPQELEKLANDQNDQTAPHALIHLQDIWQEVLDRDSIQPTDNFFDLGGHSLLLMKVSQRIQQKLGVTVSVRNLFKYNTLDTLATHIQALKPADARPLRIIKPAQHTDQVPCSFPQRRAFFMDRLDPNQVPYNIPMAFYLEGPFAIAHFLTAAARVVDRHESLRTTFGMDDQGMALQLVHKMLLPGHNIVAVDHLDTTTGEKLMRQLFQGENLRPFDMDEGPLFRLIILRFNGQRHGIILTTHHIISDGWSMNLLLKELNLCYTQAVTGETVALPTLTIQYPDYALWQIKNVDQPHQRATADYWRDQLSGNLPILPTPLPRTEAVIHRGEQLSFVVDRTTTAALNRLKDATETTLFMVLLTAAKLMLQRYTRFDDILVGTPTANRELPETEPLIGFFVNTLVLRTQLQQADTFREGLHRVRETVLDAFEHQDYPFDDLVRELAPVRDNRVTPIFQTMFSFINMEMSSPEFMGCQVEMLGHETDTALFDITIALQELDGEIYGLFGFNTSHFTRPWIEHLQQDFQALLTAMGQNLDAAPAYIPLTYPAADRDQLHIFTQQTPAVSPPPKSWTSPKGYRLPLEMLQAMLAAHPAIETVQLTVSSEHGTSNLQAEVAPAETYTGNAEQLLSDLQKQLPEDFLPHVLIFSGAVASHTTQAEPLPGAESAIAAIWQELLSVPVKDRHANFFELGGHSLLLMRIQMRLQKDLNVRLPIQDLFTHATPAALAAHIDKLKQDDGADALDHAAVAPIPTVPRDQPIPCSSPQLRAFFRDRLAPNQIPFNIPFAFHVHGQLDVVVLGEVLHQLSQRHESLRTTFAMHTTGDAIQIIHPQLPPQFDFIDYDPLTADTAQEQALLRTRAELYKPFNLDHGPLFRCLLLRLAPTQHILCLNTHHIVSDGWSMSILVREFRIMYAEILASREPELPSLAIQYADYAAWQIAALQAPDQQAAAAFWHDHLAGELPVLPTDMPRSQDEIQTGRQIEIHINSTVTTGLKQRAQAEGASLFMLLLTGVKLMFQRYGHLDDLIIGTPTANRERPETEPLVGFFVNTLALRTSLADVDDLAAALHRVRKSTMAAFAHQAYPFDHLVRKLATQRDARFSPIFQAMFSFVNMPTESLAIPGCELEGIGLDGEFVNYDFTIALQEVAGSIQGVFVYKTRHYKDDTAQAMVSFFSAVLAAMTGDLHKSPKSLVSELDQLATAARYQVQADGREIQLAPRVLAQPEESQTKPDKQPTKITAPTRQEQQSSTATSDQHGAATAATAAKQAVAASADTPIQPLSIGVPFGGYLVYLIDRHLEPVPIGVPGELCLGGESLARGYMNDPRRSAERFTPDPFAQKPGDRVYRTGDLAYYMESGDLVFVGRRDFQIKIHGYRIEPGEVENKLQELPQVKEVLVTTFTTAGGQLRLVAYTIPDDPALATDEWSRQLRSQVTEKLPAYMVPVIVALPAFPLTANDKIDRKALPEPEMTISDDYAGPRDRLEMTLTRIWETALETGPISIHDNFFEVGGHSMLSLRVAAMIETELGQPMPIASLVTNPTIAALADWLRDAGTDTPWTPLVTLNAHGDGAPLILVHPVSGNITRYVHLAKAFYGSRPVYALEAAGLDGRYEPLGSMEELVALYLDAIREVHPEGPYILGGWSLGGVVAAELAKRLGDERAKVDALLLIESFTQICNRQQPEHDVLAAFAMDLAGQAGRPLPLEREAFMQASPEQALDMIFAALASHAPHLAENEARLRDLYDVFHANMRAMSNHVPQPAPLPTLLIAATGDEHQARDPEMAENGWRHYGFDLERVDVVGNHYSILDRERIPELMQILRTVIEP